MSASFSIRATIELRLGAARLRLLRESPRARRLQAIATVGDAAGNRTPSATTWGRGCREAAASRMPRR